MSSQLRFTIERLMPEGVKRFVNHHLGFADKWYKAYVKNATERQYRKHGLDALVMFDKCLTECGYKYTLAFGSMLGAIREHGFIAHDHDIDTWMWIDDYDEHLLECLQQYGLMPIYRFAVDDGQSALFLRVHYKGCCIDIFFIYPPIDQLPYCCDFPHLNDPRYDVNHKLARRIEMPFQHEIRRVDFEGHPMPVPANAEELCIFRYGPNYMTPDPSWDWVKERNHVVEWREKIDATTATKL